LIPQSLSQSAFSTRLTGLEFNIFQALVVDFMHEFELGVWKMLFIHLIRLLYAIDKKLVVEMDRRYVLLSWISGVHLTNSRYRLVPTFGLGVIRKFSANASEMKKLAAHDYENLLQVKTSVTFLVDMHEHHTCALQCAVPVFDGLFSKEHNQIILNLLFACAHWHFLAKL
jgi:hypothetical protein